MPRGFYRGCTLPKELKDRVFQASSSRSHHGTCSICKMFGEHTQAYRDKTCPHMKSVGKYGWKGFQR